MRTLRGLLSFKYVIVRTSSTSSVTSARVTSASWRCPSMCQAIQSSLRIPHSACLRVSPPYAARVHGPEVTFRVSEPAGAPLRRGTGASGHGG